VNPTHKQEPLIITVAGVGAELSKKDTPYLPVTPEEIIASAKACEKAGARVFHLHVRDSNGAPTLNVSLIRSVMDGLRSETDLVIQLSTGGSVHDSYESRLAVLDCCPEMASLTLGSVNFGDDIFQNPRAFIRDLARKMQALKIRPELEIFDVAMMDEAQALIHEGLITPPFHFNIILGGPGWLSATEENFDFILKKMPPDSSWSGSGVGRHQKNMIEWSLARGGHVRTGLEDNIYLSKGVLAKGNEELVGAAHGAAAHGGIAQNRNIATAKQAREILGIK